MTVSDNAREVVAIVDDDSILLSLAHNVLRDDYTIYGALSGDQFFKLMDKVTPDLILLDIMMPIMDGFAVIEKLKEDETTAQIPVIFLTGVDDHESELKALTAGAVDYISKPFFPDILKMRVGLHLEMQRQKRELKELTRNAQIANSAKSTFVASMSHEMRTPLTAIIGFAELSLDNEVLNDKLYSNLTHIKRAGKTLLAIISDILDISKVETGQFKLILAEYDTATLINDALSQSSMYRNEKSINFSLVIGENFPEKLVGDELRVKQILSNLLSNAFKYTIKGDVELTLDCKIEQGEAFISMEVKDTGIGIETKDLESVFDDFVQADLKTNHKVVGTGLGLPIARRLARMMDGDIAVESEYRKGSTFTASITQQFLSDTPISPEAIEGLKNFSYLEQRFHTVETLPLLSLPYARVLVVDDVETNLAVAVGLLNRYSINYDCVDSGLKAIEAMKNENIRYSAIFMDHMMPGMDGIEATRRIREINSDYTRNIPVIAFTANAIVGSEDMFLNNGFQAFISKPIDPMLFDSIIREWVNKKQVSILDFHIDGVNIKDGLKRYFGDEGAYMNVLRAFAQSVPGILNAAEDIIEDNLEDYIIAVHGIKGSCYGICADKLAKQAEQLEFAAKEDNYDFVVSKNSAFIKNTRTLLININEVIAKIEDTKEKRQKAMPDKKLLESLLDACNRHDMNEVDEIVNELDEFTYENNGEFVKWLKEMADEMNYQEMAERLTGDTDN